VGSADPNWLQVDPSLVLCTNKEQDRSQTDSYHTTWVLARACTITPSNSTTGPPTFYKLYPLPKYVSRVPKMAKFVCNWTVNTITQHPTTNRFLNQLKVQVQDGTQKFFFLTMMESISMTSSLGLGYQEAQFYIVPIGCWVSGIEMVFWLCSQLISQMFLTW
jgi:hypothetical protein